MEWENDSHIELFRKDENAEAYITVLKVDENGSWADWEHYAAVMNNCFARKITQVGEEMKG